MNYLFLMILNLIWFMMPAFFATIIPVFVRKINFLNIPVDFNKKLNNKPIFGKSKTYRRFFFGVMASILIVFLQRMLYQYPFFQEISIINYENINFVLLGFLIGFGALFGDLIKSFFKRRLNIKSGSPWIPFDQIDYVIGTVIFVSGLLDFEKIIYMILIGGLLHYFAVKIAFKIGIRNH